MPDEKTSASNSDDRFAELVLSLQLLTPERLAECYEAQKVMRQMGMQASLQEIVERRGVLGKTQIEAVVKAIKGDELAKIPGYEIEKRLGAGGMGVVYKGTQLAVNRPVALKVLSSALVQDPLFVHRFVNEAKAVAALSHRNIVGVYDAGAADGTYFLAMEFVEGQTVQDMMKKMGFLAESTVRDIALQMAAALRYIHDKGMIHRDIKPENIMIDRGGIVKLCDFGLARQKGRDTQSFMETGRSMGTPLHLVGMADKQKAEDQGLTGAGQVVGTPLYMSPEQVTAVERLDIRSDIYSLGASLYSMLTGKPPFEGDTPVATAMKRLYEPPPDPRSIRPEVSEKMSRIVQRMMAQDVSQRFQTPDELIAALAMPTARYAASAQTKGCLGRASLILAVLAGGALLASWLLHQTAIGNSPLP